MAEMVCATNCNWLCTGNEVFPAMLEAIQGAKNSVRLETYIFSDDALGARFRAALVDAAERGCRVLVMVDGLGSVGLPNSFWDPLRAAGGTARFFNPAVAVHRLAIRDHRKILVVDDQIAFVGGFNIADEYDGDGVTCGWCDVGLKVEGPLAQQLAIAFDELFSSEDSTRHFARLRRAVSKRVVKSRTEELLLSGPGRGRNPVKRALRADLARAKDVRLVSAYFLPPWRLRRELARVAQSGGEVQFILAGKSDVKVSQLAAQSLYRRFLRSGVQIFEYQPQILHAKMVIIDDVVYIGSSNIDHRSLNINYELMIRFNNPEMAAKAREVFDCTLQHCHQITEAEWAKTRTLWKRIKQRMAYFLLVRIDPWIAWRQWKLFGVAKLKSLRRGATTI
jgi:cardiolipin synthase